MTLRRQILFALLFAIACGQSLLYSSNQNTYFLHGLTDGGLGLLSQDWMAGTADPFPVFSALVKVTYQYLSPLLLYLYFVLILGLFITAIMKINERVWGINDSPNQTFTSFVIITGLCSVLFQFLSVKLVGSDLGQLLYSGLANQYILGKVFQPSVFGVFLIVSVVAFLTQRVYWAIVFLAVATTFHPSYLLSAATLTLSYMVLIIICERDLRKSLLLGLLSLLLVAPVVIYSYATFDATSPELLQQAQTVLVEQRIPHHAQPANWFGAGAVIQLAIMVLALWVLRGQALFWIVFIPFAIGLMLTLVQVATNNHFLALLFPWRISAFLLPIASSVLIAGLVKVTFESCQKLVTQYSKAIDHSLMAALAVLVISGLVFQASRGQRYELLTKHVMSSTVKKPLYLIPLKMGAFRLRTGKPVLVDWKTHPYKDFEVLEWHKRVRAVERFYKASGDDRCDVLQHLVTDYAVTDVVYRKQQGELACPFITRVFEGDRVRVYRLK